MNFFEQQERAKRQSGRLLLLMVLAVLSLITLISVAISLALRMLNTYQGYQSYPGYGATGGIDWMLVGYVALAVVTVVSLGSLYKSMQLSRGGKVVAQRLGGRLINLEPQTFEERRLLNVVEEMALAAGTPVPAVYVLDELSINAFAAGLTPQDAVIGITRGAIELLSRDELQGVIAHEFSHIFHGDMRLNTRLVAVLHGILLLGLIGGFVLRSFSGRSSRSSRDNSGLVVLAIGGTLLVLGYAGTFFGNLIKAAVSRQREFLADAAAVQYTRNPDSIGGALKKIGGFPLGSQIQARNAAEFSHLYFGQGLGVALSGWLATHPPLAERIRRVDPGWDGQFPAVKLNQAPASDAQAPGAPGEAEVAGSWDRQMAGLEVAAGFSPAALTQSIAAIGEPQPAHLQQARNALQQIPEPLKAAAHSCEGGQALAYGLMLDRESGARQRQLDLLRPQLQAEVATALEALDSALVELGEGLRLPLLELTIPALKQLSKSQWALLQRNLIMLAKADRKIDLLEWTLLRILQRNIEGARPLNGKYHLLELADESALLLSALAHAGHAQPEQAAQAFASARMALPFDHLAFADDGMPNMQALDQALGRLNQMWPLQKPRLLKAMACCIEHDGQVTATEAELLRAVADMLDCPMPPLLAD
nr:M48 family metallopeptidase [uncultured Pseudomonas sp.]